MSNINTINNGVYLPNSTHSVLIMASNTQATIWFNNQCKYKVTTNRSINNPFELISEHSEKLPNSKTSYGTLTSVYLWVTPTTAKYLVNQRNNGIIVFTKVLKI